MADVELLVGEQQTGESKNAILACNDYLRAGAGRSLAKLLEHYRNTTETPPVKQLKTLKDWSRKFGWVDRATAYDATWEQRKNAAREAEFNQALALDYERVRKLKAVADFLEQQILEQVTEVIPANSEHNPTDEPITITRNPNVWLQDVKGIREGDNYKKVTIERFNAQLFEQYRRTLEDLAKETGGRISRHEHAGPEGGDIPIKTTVDGMTEILKMMGRLDGRGASNNDTTD